MEHPKVVTPAEWLAARKELLKKEKEFSRLRDQLSRQRRELPWEKVEKAYVFDGQKGKETLADLFGGRSQLIVYHFMLGPAWVEGCPSCSFVTSPMFPPLDLGFELNFLPPSSFEPSGRVRLNRPLTSR